MTPFNDQVTIGSDVLLLGGEMYCVNCIFYYFLGLGSFIAAGQLAVLGGTMVLTNPQFIDIQLVTNGAGAGQVLFVGGK